MPRKFVAVCRGNTCRSPLAEALLRKHFDRLGRSHEFIFESAGYLKNGSSKPASPFWKMLEQEIGVCLDGHQSRHLSEVQLREVHAFIALCPEAVAALDSLGVPSYRILLVNDPSGIPNPKLCLEGYRKTFRAVSESLEYIIRYIS